ncbi:alpha-tocopherol transfer protein-like [Diorhabda carinulata]|uniref:alpha-tocopherol transfer protein-like n=1 Tax=Diorhabda carinulata TaxID=1163345 RepID=UPI0025A1F0B7|nr:alpha-tocopherol transfer protein-like [Diorhabda carinulata]
MPDYFIIDKDTRKNILEEYTKTEKDLAQDVQLLVDWFKTQHHLPEIPSRNMIRYFLINNKFSLQRTKEKIDMYYTIRSSLPDLYGVINPKFERIKKHNATCHIIPLPKLLDGKHRIILSQEQNVPLSQMDGTALIGRILNMQEVRFEEDIHMSNIALIDCQNINLNHTLAFTPTHVKMAVMLFYKVYTTRLKEIHVFNHNTVVTIFVNLFAAFTKQKIMKRIHLHDNIDSLKKHFPLDVLPKDYGGTLPPIEKLSEAWLAKLEEYQDRFDTLDSMEVNEALRSVPLNEVSTYGIQGSFKTLSFD